jgi:hypothetical protein
VLIGCSHKKARAIDLIIQKANCVKIIAVSIYSNIMVDCSNNQLNELPTLRPSLKAGNCTQRLLPDNLQTLYCHINQLNELPTLLPSLKAGNCTQRVLPTNLQELVCDNNPNLEYTNEYLKQNKKFENVIKKYGKLYEP